MKKLILLFIISIGIGRYLILNSGKDLPPSHSCKIDYSKWAIPPIRCYENTVISESYDDSRVWIKTEDNPLLLTGNVVTVDHYNQIKYYNGWLYIYNGNFIYIYI